MDTTTMPIIEFLKGHIALPKVNQNLFQMTKLYRDYILTQEIINDEPDPVSYSEIGNKLYIEFSDLSVDNYSEIIESDLSILFNKISPGPNDSQNLNLNFDVNILLWTADQDFNAKNYFTNELGQLQVKELMEAPTRTIASHQVVKIYQN